MSLPDDLDKHSVYLGRLATQLLRANIFPSYDAAYKAVRLILLDAETIGSPTKLSLVNKAIAKAIEAATTSAWESTTNELTALAVYESSYYAELIGGYAGIRMKTPPQRQVKDWMQKALMALESNQRSRAGTWPEFVAGNQGSFISTVQSLVKRGYINGSTVNEMVRELRPLVDGLIKRDAEALVRTAVAFYSNQGRQQMVSANKDLIAREVPFVTFDNRTSNICRSIDSLYSEGWPVGESPIGYPPYHFGCLSEDTLVTTCSDVSNVYKRAYEGVMVNFTTESGRCVKITPNHPVLTSRGWVKAGDLNLLDQVVSIENIGEFAGKDYKNSAVSEFGEMFSALDVLIDPSLVSIRPTTTEDFHGDTTDTNVKVINIDSLGWDSFRKESPNCFKDGLFPFRSSVVRAFHSFCSLHSFRPVSFPAFGGLVSRFGKFGDLLRCGYSHSCKLLLRPISKFSVKFQEITNNRVWSARKPHLFSNTVCTNAGIVERSHFSFLSFSKLVNSRIFKLNPRVPDNSVTAGLRNAENLTKLDWQNARGAKLEKLVDLVLVQFSGHVYNLENKDNWYLSNGIVTHNCRTTILPLVEGQEMPDGLRPAIGAKDTQEAKDKFEAREERTGKKPKYRGRKDLNVFEIDRIKADTRYDAWLRRQPDFFIKDVLGEARFKLFKEGGYSLSSFSDLTLRQLTLKELQERDAETFRRLGIRP